MRKKLILLQILVGALVSACSRDAATPEPAASANPVEAASDAPGVDADKHTQHGLGIELAGVTSVNVSAEFTGTATVVDSATFAQAMADLDSLRAESAVAIDNAKRVEALFEDDGNASRQAAVSARRQSSSSQAKLTGAETRARLDWGARLTSSGEAGAKLRREIVTGAVTLFRAEFPNSLSDAAGLRYQLGHTRQPSMNLEFVERSRAAAQFSAGDSVLLALHSSGNSDASFRPGERLPVLATAPGDSHAAVPAAAAIAYQGRLWCYVSRDGDRFDRVPLNEGVGGSGSYAVDGLRSGDRVVVKGAALLLSLERSGSAEAGAGAEE